MENILKLIIEQYLYNSRVTITVWLPECLNDSDEEIILIFKSIGVVDQCLQLIR